MRGSFKLVIVSVALAATLTGCSKDPKARLQGSWQGKECLDCDDMDKAEAAAWAETLALTFDQSKLTVKLGKDQSRTDEFEVIDVKGDRLSLRFKNEAASGTEPVQLEFKGSNLVLNMGEKRNFLMVRKK